MNEQEVVWMNFICIVSGVYEYIYISFFKAFIFNNLMTIIKLWFAINHSCVILH